MQSLLAIGARVSALLLLSVLLVSAGATSASADINHDQIVAATNAERAKVGQPALARNSRLDAAAQEWAQTMSSSGNFVHSTTTWRSTRVDAGWTGMGENIAAGYPAAGAVMIGWMNSPGHRDNILRSSYTHMGVGFVARGNYWVQLFATYPRADAGPWPIMRPAHLSTIYELVSADGAVTPTALSFERWTTVYNSRTPLVAPTRFVKYAWSPSVYAVTQWPGGESSWQWEHLAFDQWRHAGFPNAVITGWIAGSSIYKWDTGSELFLSGADRTVRKLTPAEWAATGTRPFENRSGQGYLKLSWNPTIVYSPDTSSLQSQSVDYASWKAAAFPTPQQRSRFPGDAFYKFAGSPDIFYTGPTLDRAITFQEWSGAGWPVPELRPAG
ncbi:hypothetical protein ABIB15_002373 [Marisediminicola sp. UYEF4]|uniref:CAP domain-containing protein n=1 Tax=Marisediminicola sp. UYEF4 TaxID=1756384 RepID=UPI0033933D9B